MSQLLTSISKLSMDSGKDSAVGDVFVVKHQPDLKNRLGTIVGIIELFGQPDEFVDKLFEIINDLQTEYYLPPFENEGGVEKRFEECLQRANRRINKAINDSIEEIELKNINALIGLISRNKIHLSQIGQNNALLFHRKKKYDYLIVDIFSQASEKSAKINQEKMFSNIISGAITEKDNVFFCNDAVLEYISQNELMEITTEDSPVSALKEIESILEKDKENNNFYAIAIEPIVKEGERKIEAVVANQESNIDDDITEKHRVPSQTSINKLISTQVNTEKYLAPSMAPNWKKALMIIAWATRVSINFTWKYLKIGLIELIKIIKISFNYLKEKTPVVIDLIARKFNKKSSNHTNLSDQPVGIKPEDKILSVVELDEKPKDDIAKENNYHHYHKKNRDIATIISDWLNNQIAKFVSLKKMPKILFIIVMVLIFFFSQSMVWQGQVTNNSEKTSATDLIKQIEEELNAAEAKNIFNDEEGAKESLQLAINLMNEILNSKKYKDDKEKLQQRIDELNKSLQRISYVDNPNVISDLYNQNQSASVSTISKYSNFVFAFDNQNQNIYKIDLDKKQTISRQLAGNFNNVKKIDALDENNVIILNGDSELYKYNFETNSAENSLTSNEKITDISIYGGKLYTLKSEQGQILKHFPVDNGYNSGSSWIKDGTDIKDSLSFTIDGGVYIIYNNGDIKHLLNGKLVESSFSSITPSINASKQIYSDGDSNYLYILDQNNQRVVVFDKNSGNIKIQYSSKSFADMKSMTVDTKAKKIYILADKKIYSIDITN